MFERLCIVDQFVYSRPVDTATTGQLYISHSTSLFIVDQLSQSTSCPSTSVRFDESPLHPNLYSNVVHFFKIRHLRQPKTVVFLQWCLICTVLLECLSPKIQCFIFAFCLRTSYWKFCEYGL